MQASEAVLWFSDTPLSGWNGTAWVDEISWGDFLTYDRFITDRTFGVKKRLFLCHDDYEFDALTYRVVKTPDGKQWIVVANNVDLAGEVDYAHTYLLLEASYTASILETQTITTASGQVRRTGEEVVATYPCDFEQFGVDFSDVSKQAVYGVYNVTLPGGVQLSEQNEIEIDGLIYAPQEITNQLLTTTIRAERRSPSVPVLS